METVQQTHNAFRDLNGLVGRTLRLEGVSPHSFKGYPNLRQGEFKSFTDITENRCLVAQHSDGMPAVYVRDRNGAASIIIFAGNNYNIDGDTLRVVGASKEQPLMLLQTDEPGYAEKVLKEAGL